MHTEFRLKAWGQLRVRMNASGTAGYSIQVKQVHQSPLTRDLPQPLAQPAKAIIQHAARGVATHAPQRRGPRLLLPVHRPHKLGWRLDPRVCRQVCGDPYSTAAEDAAWIVHICRRSHHPPNHPPAAAASAATRDGHGADGHARDILQVDRGPHAVDRSQESNRKVSGSGQSQVRNAYGVHLVWRVGCAVAYSSWK